MQSSFGIASCMVLCGEFGRKGIDDFLKERLAPAMRLLILLCEMWVTEFLCLKSFRIFHHHSFLWIEFLILNGLSQWVGKRLSWIPPPVGIFKFNFDGASKGNLGLARFGCVIRDHVHNVIGALYGLLAVCDAITAETTSLLIGLSEVNHLGLYGCEVEGDLAVVISWENRGGIGSWNLISTLYEI